MHLGGDDFRSESVLVDRRLVRGPTVGPEDAGIEDSERGHAAKT